MRKLGGENNDVWPTPDRVYRPLDELLRFDLDTAADRHNARCLRFYTERDDGLVQPWDGRSVWTNPPYGKNTGAWVAKGRAECRRFHNRVTMLLPIKADTTWWHDGVWGRNRVVAADVLFGPLPGRWYRLREERHLFVEVLELRGRISFGGGDNTGWFASAVVLFNAGKYPVLPRLA